MFAPFAIHHGHVLICPNQTWGLAGIQTPEAIVKRKTDLSIALVFIGPPSPICSQSPPPFLTKAVHCNVSQF